MFYNKYYGGDESTDTSNKPSMDILNEIYNKFSENLQKRTNVYEYNNFKDNVTKKYFMDKFITCIRSPYSDKDKLKKLEKLICNSNVIIDFYNIPKNINNSIDSYYSILWGIIILLIINLLALIFVYLK